MSKLIEENDILVLKISGPDFDSDLVKVKETAGRRFNPTNKTWEFANDAETLMKIAFSIEPQMSAELMSRVKASKAEITQELLTKLPDDAELMVPWADRLVPRQRAGVEFMVEHPHTILADEMGGGKTVQAITTVFEYLERMTPEDREDREDAPRLIISPNSVTGHWKDELQKWAGVDSVLLTGSSKQKAAQLKDALLTDGVWIIVNWEAIRLLPELAKVRWLAVIADEAHRGKNRKAKQTKALWKLRAPIQLALTGTPIMSSPGDLWAILKWMRREQYSSYWAFLANYAETYSGFRGKQIVVGVKNADSLRFELSDKLVRRTKREIHADIPEPFPPIKRVIAMKPKQAAVYQEALKDFWLEIAAEAPEIAKAEELPEAKIREDLAKAVDDPGGVEMIKYMIRNPAARLTRLRQVATSPALLGGEDESGKLDAVIETITDAEEDRPFVVFAWYKPTVQLVIDRLAAKGIEAKGFTGDTKPGERHALAESFQSGDYQVIVPTLAVGGVGIDLYRSSDPLLAESDWVPATNRQAIDRCDRKGQTASVQGQYFYSEDSVDTGRLMPKQKLYQSIVETILGG